MTKHVRRTDFEAQCGEAPMLVGDAATAAAGRCEAPDVTLAVCTHNRAQQLGRLLDAVAGDLARTGVKLIIIDSASRPEEAAAVRQVVSRHRDVELCRSEVAGVSLARNLALSAATTSWLAFVDDDELPAAGWVDALLGLVERLPGDCAGCGGNVVADWAGLQQPRQLGRRWREYLSLIWQDGEFDQTAAPKFGIGHSVVRVSALRSVGGFDLRVGRDDATLLSGEEVLLLEQLVQSGWRIWHSDQLSVAHSIAAERLTRSWARQRAFWEGVSVTRVRRIVHPDGSRLSLLQAHVRYWGLWALHCLAGSRAELDLRLAAATGALQETMAWRRRRLDQQRAVAKTYGPQAGVTLRPRAQRRAVRTAAPGSPFRQSAAVGEP